MTVIEPIKTPTNLNYKVNEPQGDDGSLDLDVAQVNKNCQPINPQGVGEKLDITV